MKLMLIILTVLQSLLATLEQKTLVSDFSISIAEQQSQPMTYTGDLAMHGKQFRLSMFSMDAAYDDNTLYMYSEDTEELTLSTPTEEELTQTNPFLYAQALLPVCEQTEKTVGDKMQVKASGGVRCEEDAIKVINSGATRIGASASIAIVTGQTSKSDY